MDETRDCKDALGPIPYLPLKEIADIAAARNLAMDGALLYADENPDCDTLVIIDDDMTFTPQNVDDLVSYSRTLKDAVSGLYVLRNGAAAASYVRDVPVVGGEPWMSRRFLCGLGFCAIPMARLRTLREISARTMANNTPMTCFTWTGPDQLDGLWYSEDTRLCNRMGGMILAPIGVGHIKPLILRPDAETVARVKNGVQLPDRKPS